MSKGKWILHNGGKMPVAHRTLVHIKTRDGGKSTYLFAGTDDYMENSTGGYTAEDWTHDGSDGDIIAYQVVGNGAVT